MTSRKNLLLLVSFFATLWILYQFVFTIPELIDAWDLIQHYSHNSEYSKAFTKIFSGLIIQLCFYGSVALWSFNEALEKDSIHSVKTSPKQRIETSTSKYTGEHYETVVGQINYLKLLKPMGILLVLGGVGFFVWNAQSSYGKLESNLFLFSALVIIGVALWIKGKEATKKNAKIKPTKNFKHEYEEKKRREMEDRI